jgi:hypothetical protein
MYPDQYNHIQEQNSTKPVFRPIQNQNRLIYSQNEPDNAACAMPHLYDKVDQTSSLVFTRRMTSLVKASVLVLPPRSAVLMPS